MKFELTEDEVTTVLVALDNYRDLMQDRFHWSGDEADQQAEGSAEWIWQKIMGAREVDPIEAEVRANSPKEASPNEC
jgi:hypothetical protein